MRNPKSLEHGKRNLFAFFMFLEKVRYDEGAH